MSRPFSSRSQEVVLSLLRTTDLVRRRFEQVVEPAGVTLQQYNVLRILRGAGEEGLPTLEVAERMVEQTPGITRLVDRLERKGWVVRQRCDRDRRRVYCTITPAGTRLLDDLEPAVQGAGDHVLEGLGEQALDNLVGLLDRVRDAFRGADGQPTEGAAPTPTPQSADHGTKTLDP